MEAEKHLLVWQVMLCCDVLIDVLKRAFFLLAHHINKCTSSLTITIFCRCKTVIRSGTIETIWNLVKKHDIFKDMPYCTVLCWINCVAVWLFCRRKRFRFLVGRLSLNSAKCSRLQIHPAISLNILVVVKPVVQWKGTAKKTQTQTRSQLLYSIDFITQI